MRKNLISYTTITSLIFSALACSNADERLSDNEQGFTKDVARVVTFYNASESLTRVGESQFDTGDAIGVFVSTKSDGSLSASNNYADNEKYVYTSGEFINTGAGIPVANNLGRSVHYYAVYPYQEGVTTSYTFTVSDDQSTYEKYMRNDLMFAYHSAGYTQNRIPLQFDHMMSRVQVDANSLGLYSGNYRIELVGFKYSATVDLATKTVSTTGPASSKNLLMCDDGANHFKALLPPQMIHKSDVVGSITIGGRRLPILINSDVELQSGKSVTLKLKKNGDQYYLAF